MVALFADAGDSRQNLARYLRSAGFDVVECDEQPLPRSFGALVAIGTPDSNQAVLDQVRSWLRLAKHQSVVVVTSNPSAFKVLQAAHSERLSVLPAPAFGWDVVDALRGASAPRPRGA